MDPVGHVRRPSAPGRGPAAPGRRRRPCGGGRGSARSAPRRPHGRPRATPRRGPRPACTSRSGKAAASRGERRGDRPRRRASTARNAGLSMPAAATSARDDRELGRIGARAGAVDDRVGRAQDAEQRPAAAAVLGRALDQPRDLDELDEDAADPGQRRDRAQRRERVVAGLDLDLGQGLEERRLADVRRADQRDLGGALAADGDRVAVDGARADARVLDLGEQRLAQVRVRPVLVVGQLGEQRADLADPLLDPLCRPADASPPGRTSDAASA